MVTRKETWNERHKLASDRLKTPSVFLVENIELLKSGSVLDLASGSGRNALFLAQTGYSVTALDFSEVALDQVKKQALESNHSINTIECDLDQEHGLRALETYDAVIAIHFKLSETLLSQIPRLLEKSGVFLYCTFNLEQAQKKTFPEKYCLKKGELLDRKWPLELIKYTSFEDNDGFHDGYVFRKK